MANMTTLQILQGIKDWIVGKLTAKVNTSIKVNGHALTGDVTVSKTDVGLGNVTNDSQVKRSEMGAASGVATLDSSGKVPSSQLPSYVDDVLEYDTKSAFPATGDGGKIYVDKSNNTTWRWSGSTYTQIKGDLTIGTTSGTAADGKIVNDHVNNTSNPHGVTKAQVGLGSVVNTGDSDTPVSGGTTKFTTGGAYTELAKKVDKVSGATAGHLAGLNDSGDVTDSGVAAEDAIKNAENITWAVLKAKRDNSQLISGRFYRITDYQCTTTQENTQSAGHQFDIIVRADGVNVLNENAYAAKHSGDTYFTNAGAKLEAWELKYCLDNDTNKFAWADATNGKGVIYWMKDEWNNECPYDFKNIMFAIDATKISDNAEDGDTYYCYTFSTFDDGYDEPNSIHDESVFASYYINEDGEGKFGNNIIKPYYFNSSYKLSSNVFLTDWQVECVYHFGNTIGVYSHSNIFNSYTHSNTFGNSCSNNTFGNNCSGNTFGPDCSGNTFGLYCSGNTFGNNCSNNTFGNSCSNNTFGNNCFRNTFGPDCSGNTFGLDCSGNTFGNNCSGNTFGDGCQYNTFGNSCSNNTFGNNCSSIKFGTSSAVKDYVQYVIVENGNIFIYLDCSATTSSSSPMTNVKIMQGVNNTTTYKTITHTTAGDTFQTIYKPVNSVEVSV